MPKQPLPLAELLFWQKDLRHEMQLARDTLFVSSFLWKLKLHISPDVQCLALTSIFVWSLQARQGNKQLPALFCVPFIVKDNFDTAGMAGTAGSVALLDNYPLHDAEQVRNAHAVIPQPSYTGMGVRTEPALLQVSAPRVTSLLNGALAHPVDGHGLSNKGCAVVEMLACSLHCQCSQPHLSALGR